MSDDNDDIIIYDDNISPGKEIKRKLRSEVPADHRTSTDTRVEWMWSQRLATIQSIKMRSTDILDVMAATLVLSAAMAGNLPSIELVLQRLEGGAITDEEELDRSGLPV